MRTILLSGACGAGKSATLRLGARAYGPHFGRTATFDTDELLMMVRARARGTAVRPSLYEQCWLLADSFA